MPSNTSPSTPPSWLRGWTTTLPASYNRTQRHTGHEPKDDRPKYLHGDPYRLAVDTETTGLAWYDGRRPFIATASDYDRDYLFDLADPEDCAALQRAMDTADELIFHNAPFDLLMLDANAFRVDHLFDKVHDTRLLAPIVLGDVDGGHHLKNLATLLLDPEARHGENEVLDRMVALSLIQKRDQKYKPDGAYYEVWQAYPDILEAYALLDTRYTYDLFHVLWDKADVRARTEVYPLERAVQPHLIRLMRRGVRVNRGQVAKMITQFESDKTAAWDRLQASVKDPEFNPGSSAQVAAHLQVMNTPLTVRAPKGEGWSTAKWVLEDLMAAGHASEFLEPLLDWRSADKVLGTYLYPMQAREIVHADFQQLGAWTSRMSCRKPNLQNIPVRRGTEVRSCFVPRTGHKLIVADFASIELRLLDMYMGANSPLGDIIEDGDPFLWLGEQIYGTSDVDKWPVARGPLKNGFYAMTYGAGGPRFAKTVGGGMTPAEGKATIKKIKQALGSSFYDLTDAIRTLIEGQGYIRTLTGRKQHVSRDKSYVGLNALIQGSAAELMKEAFVRVSDNPLLEEWAYNPLLIVHDELVGEVPTKFAKRALALVCEIMASVDDMDTTERLILKAEGAVCSHYGEGK